MDFSNRFSETLLSASMRDRMELKALVDYYATERDKNNQDCYAIHEKLSQSYKRRFEANDR